eukprot:scaffold50459_cov60-Phaeocystis_antarctica.AAC.2
MLRPVRASNTSDTSTHALMCVGQSLRPERCMGNLVPACCVERLRLVFGRLWSLWSGPSERGTRHPDAKCVRMYGPGPT